MPFIQLTKIQGGFDSSDTRIEILLNGTYRLSILEGLTGFSLAIILNVRGCRNIRRANFNNSNLILVNTKINDELREVQA